MVIQFFILLSILIYILSFILNKIGLLSISFNSNLNCGIFAFAGSKKPNLEKLKILGIYNEIRGNDSCGIYDGRRIYKGIGVTSKFTNFLAANKINPTGKIFIGHTRKASSGSVSLENAHPISFSYEDDEGNTKGKCIGVHNGTIYNTQELKTLFGLRKSLTQDSKVLIGALSCNSSQPHIRGVLDEYKGGAAVVWHYTNNPDSLFIFKGGCLKNNTITEDRPLFYLKTTEGFYISSMEESLKAIKAKNGRGEITSFSTNHLYEIKKGKLLKYKYKYRADAKYVDQLPSYSGYTANQHYGNSYGYLRGGGSYSSNSPSYSNTNSSINTPKKMKAFEERYFNQNIDGINWIRFYNGRYKKSGNNLTGFHHVDKYGRTPHHDDYDSLSAEKVLFIQGLAIAKEFEKEVTTSDEGLKYMKGEKHVRQYEHYFSNKLREGTFYITISSTFNSSGEKGYVAWGHDGSMLTQGKEIKIPFSIRRYTVSNYSAGVINYKGTINIEEENKKEERPSIEEEAESSTFLNFYNNNDSKEEENVEQLIIMESLEDEIIKLAKQVEVISNISEQLTDKNLYTDLHDSVAEFKENCQFLVDQVKIKKVGIEDTFIEN
jgi:predicted glutamine amidotransferase